MPASSFVTSAPTAATDCYRLTLYTGPEADSVQPLYFDVECSDSNVSPSAETKTADFKHCLWELVASSDGLEALGFDTNTKSGKEAPLPLSSAVLTDGKPNARTSVQWAYRLGKEIAEYAHCRRETEPGYTLRVTMQHEVKDAPENVLKLMSGLTQTAATKVGSSVP